MVSLLALARALYPICAWFPHGTVTPPSVPVIATPPAITGTIQVGHTATVSTGSWANSPTSYTYQWYGEGIALAGAGNPTTNSYTFQTTDIGSLITCAVTAINGNGASFPALTSLAGPTLGATTIYVSQSGGNDSTGTGTIGNPYKTLAKVNALAIAAGTSVLFKRGDTWRGDGGVYAWATQLLPDESGTASNPIVYDAYGTGANPIFDGSVDASTTAKWTNVGTNLWQSAATFAPNSSNGLPNNQANDIGNILWGVSAVGGTNVPAALKHASTGTMTGGGVGGVWYNPGDGTANLGTTQGNWNFNTDNNKVQVYSAGNPATAMSGLVLAVDTCCIYAVNVNYLIFQNLTLQFTAAVPFLTQGTCTHITVRDCVAQWYGGGNISGHSDANSRYGDGMDYEGSIQFGLFERNWIYQGYDVGFGPQCGPGTAPAGHQDNLIMRNNVVVGCNSGYSTFQLGSGTMNSVDVCNFYNNTIIGLGNTGSWSNTQRPNGGSTNVVGMAPIMAGQTNLKIYNNIFAEIGGSGGDPGFGIDATHWNEAWSSNLANPYTSSGDWLDWNCWPKNTKSNATQQIALHTGNFAISTWRAGTMTAGGTPTFSPALEANGVFDQDPLFVNQSGFNFALQSGSPCLNAGTNLYSAGVVWDINHNPRPASGAFAMGAFQVPTTPPVNISPPVIS